MKSKAAVLLDDVYCQELDAFLVERIYEFNSKVTGHFDGRLLGVRIQNDAGEIIAGISGHTWGACAEIVNFWVSERYRGQGLGSTLLGAAEAEAIRRGCTQAVLRTHSFQAPEFYSRRGYLRRCEVKGQPKGHSDILFVKSFTNDSGM
jgi:GNAT superfamily N-acetyltransferase